eukprot:189582_1
MILSLKTCFRFFDSSLIPILILKLKHILMLHAFPKHLLNIYNASRSNDDDSTKHTALSLNIQDKRIRAEKQHYSERQSYIHSIGLLRCTFENFSPIPKDNIDAKQNSKEYVCVGTAVILKTGSDNLYLLTCAHNILQLNKWKNDWVEAKQIVFELRMNTQRFIFQNHSQLIDQKRFTVIDRWIHNKYKEQWWSNAGYDIAILKCGDLEEHINIPKTIETMNMFKKLMNKIEQYKENRTLGCEYKQYEEKKYTNGQEACVVGFPAEQRGQLYGMKGIIYTHLENARLNGRVIMYEIVTSGGQSGSPILIGHINDKCVYDGKKTIVGIHTGGENGLNWGTKITKETFEWIESTLRKNECDEPSMFNNELLFDRQYEIQIKSIENDLKKGVSSIDYPQAIAELSNMDYVINSWKQRLYL